MCLAVPAKIVSIDEATLTADVDIIGNTKKIGIMLTPQVQIGSWVLIHAGQAITTVSDEDAAESLAMFEEILKDEL